MSATLTIESVQGNKKDVQHSSTHDDSYDAIAAMLRWVAQTTEDGAQFGGITGVSASPDNVSVWMIVWGDGYIDQATVEVAPE